MLIGILFSSGYSSIVSKNYTGLVWNNDFPDEVNEDNMLLFVNEERNVGDYTVNYLGERKKLKDYSGYINKNFLELIPLENKYIIKKDLSLKGIDFKENDTVDVDNNDITYFELNFEKGKEVFTLYPKVQTDPNSDMIVFSPDVSNDIFQDLYVHVRTYPDPEQEINWSETDSILVPIDQTFFLNDYVSRLLKVSTKTISEDSKQFVAEAQIKILASGQDYVARPAFIINDNKVGIVPDIIDDLGIKVSITEIIPEKGLFKIKYQTTQKNWVIVEAMQKPFINFMWIGFFILTLGLALSFNKIKLKKNMISISLFASGSGSNVEEIFNYFKGHPKIKVDSLFCNNDNAYVIERAKSLNLHQIIFDNNISDEELLKLIDSRNISYIVLAGYLRLIPQIVIDKYENKIINIHPSLLPKFGGKGYYGSRVHESVIGSKEKYSGITIHLVDEEYDKGKILFQKKIQIKDGETPDSLAQKIHKLEHIYFSQILEKYLLDKL